MDFKIAEGAEFILNKLNNCGYEAYVVGGCVRDIFLGRSINDWDICTSAKPTEVMKIFSGEKVIPTGLKHGTVTIVLDGEQYEVTTYRIDGEYFDSRRPESVDFTDDIAEDLKRRDFTINAMAYSLSTGLVDLFGGCEDLKKGVIKCVGNPKKRFSEDALRILRAWRFSCQLGFKIDESTLLAAYELRDNIKNISSERIMSELVKAIQSTANFVEGVSADSRFLEMVIPEWSKTHIPQNNPHHIYNVDKHILKALEYTADSDDLTVKLAVLLHDIGKPYCYTEDENGIGHFYGHSKKSAVLAENILKRLRFDNSTADNVTELILYHDTEIKAESKYIKRWLGRIGEEQLKRLIFLKQADASGQSGEYAYRIDELTDMMDLIDEIVNSGQCITVKDLAVNGRDLIDIGYSQGKGLGEVLAKMLECVISDKIENDREKLLQFAKDELKRI